MFASPLVQTSSGCNWRCTRRPVSQLHNQEWSRRTRAVSTCSLQKKKKRTRAVSTCSRFFFSSPCTPTVTACGSSVHAPSLANWMTLPGHGKVRSIEGGADVVARERVEAPAKPEVIRIIRPALQAAVEAVVADRTLTEVQFNSHLLSCCKSCMKFWGMSTGWPICSQTRLCWH